MTALVRGGVVAALPADIPPGWIALIVVMVGAFGTGGYFAQRAKNRNDTIDQYQEDRKDDRERIAKLETRADAAAQRERIRDDYIALLRVHISEGLPPPPPPFPPGLLGGHQ